MKVLITGSGGFIGSHLGALLKSRGHCVYGIDSDFAEVPDWLKMARRKHSGVEPLRCDIRDKFELASTMISLAPDVVVHLAAKPGVAGAESNTEIYDAVNVTGVENLLYACRQAKVRRVVHASSSSVYGDVAGPVSEKADLRPVGRYGRTKVRGEELLEAASKSGDISALILRPFTVVGPLGRPDMAAWRFAEILFSGKPVTVHEGAGRDFTAVADVAAAFALAAEASVEGCSAINIGSGNPRSAIELAQSISAGLGVECRMALAPLPRYMPTSTHADVSRAREMLGWEPKVTFADGLSEFIRWFVSANPDIAVKSIDS